MNHYIETAVKALVALQVIRMQQITDLKASNAPQTAITALQHDYQDLVDAEEEIKNNYSTEIIHREPPIGPFVEMDSIVNSIPSLHQNRATDQYINELFPLNKFKTKPNEQD